MMVTLPRLEIIIEQVVGKHLQEGGFPARISTQRVRQFHVQVHLRYYQPGRVEKSEKNQVKNAVRAYLEKEYQYVEERDNNPLKPGHSMIVGAHYERKKTKE